MKILVIVDSYPPHHSGGYELRCKDVIGRLIKKGHSTVILTTRAITKNGISEKDEKNVLRVLHSEDNSKSLLQRISADVQDLKVLKKCIHEFRPDIIYLWHTINLSRAIFPYLAEIAIPIVYDEGGAGLTWVWQHHGPWYTMIDRKSGSAFKNWMKAVAADLLYGLSGHLIKQKWIWPELNAYFNSEFGRERAAKLQVPLKKAAVIPSGIDLTAFPYRPDDRLGEPVRLIAPGRMVPQKGIKDAVLLLMELVKSNVPAKLAIVGKIGTEACFNEIDALICDNHLQAFVQVVPFLAHKEMAALYRESDFCFFPSYQKYGFSRVPLEAMASGCAVLSYGNEASGEVIQDGIMGYLLPEGDVAAAAERIIQMRNAPDLYQTMIRTARDEIEQHYAMDQYVEKIEAFLVECAGQ